MVSLWDGKQWVLGGVFLHSSAVLKGNIFQSIGPSLLFLEEGLGAALFSRYLWFFESDGTQCLEFCSVLTAACWNGCDLPMRSSALTLFFWKDLGGHALWDFRHSFSSHVADQDEIIPVCNTDVSRLKTPSAHWHLFLPFAGISQGSEEDPEDHVLRGSGQGWGPQEDL